MPNQTPLESKNIFSRAAGYLSFLRSCIRSGEDLDEKEHAAVDRIIAELMKVGTQEPEAKKNEHIVWGYAPMPGKPGVAIFIGLTDAGVEHLKEHPGWTLDCRPPDGMHFADVSVVVVFHAPTKQAIKDLIGGATGAPVQERS